MTYSHKSSKKSTKKIGKNTGKQSGKMVDGAPLGYKNHYRETGKA